MNQTQYTSMTSSSINDVSQTLTKSEVANNNNNSVQDCLQILANKIDERFKKIASAFRFFDLRSTG